MYRHFGPGILWCRGQSVLQTVLVIGGAGPFLGHHAGAYGMVGGAEPGEDGAVLREAFPLKDLAAAAGRVGSPFHFSCFLRSFLIEKPSQKLPLFGKNDHFLVGS